MEQPHDTSYRDIGEIKILTDEKAVNEQLKNGWVLLTISTRNTGEDLQSDSVINYVVGRPKPRSEYF